MSTLAFAVDPTPAADHPALAAWEAAGGRSGPAVEVDHLVRRGRPYAKSGIFRLRGLPGTDTVVIAKRARPSTTSVERTVYQELLPELGGVRLYAAIELDGEGWLFLEEAPAERFDPNSIEHRRLAGRWFARFHLATARPELRPRFPEEDTPRYLAHVVSARERVLAARVNARLPAGGRGSLARTLEQLARAEAALRALAGECASLPHCVIHADVAPKNLRLGARGGLVVLDWETAGWGSPCPDLEHLDLDAYREVVDVVWPDLDLSRLRRIGLVLRNVGLIDATALTLTSEWPERALAAVEPYTRVLATALDELDAA